MLIYARKHVQEHGGNARNLALYGQDAGGSAWTMGKMNTILHGIENAHIANADVLVEPAFLDGDGERMFFDRILANPPFSMNYEGENMKFKGRFAYGFTKENGKRGDLMFLQHMLFSLRPSGMVATVMPHGVLFRGGDEGKIRQQLIAHDHLEAIIGLPPNLFYGTGIPACIMVLRPNPDPDPETWGRNREKPEERRGKVLFINADREFEPGRAQNSLRAEHIEKIAATFRRFEAIAGYSAVVDGETLQAPGNDGSLNIRRYADNSPPPEPHDVRAHLHGGVPRAEVDALTPLLSAHGLDPARLFVGGPRGDGYLNFAPALSTRPDLRAAVESDPGARAREATLEAAFSGWWMAHRPRLEDLPATRDPMPVRADLLGSFGAALSPVGLLDRFQIAGALVTWWEEGSDEWKTVAARGFDELVDGWVDTIRDVLEDGESRKDDRNAAREHKLVRQLLPDYLRELEEAAAEVARLEEEKAAFERGPNGEATAGDDAETGEEAAEVEVVNYAETLETELRAARQALRELRLARAGVTANGTNGHARPRRGRPARVVAAGTGSKNGEPAATNILPFFAEVAATPTATLLARVATLETEMTACRAAETPPAYVNGFASPTSTDPDALAAEIERLDALLDPWRETKRELTAAKRHLRELEAALLTRLQAARDALDSIATRDLVLDLARAAISRVLTAGVIAHRRRVLAAVENLWDKYRVALNALETERAATTVRLGGMLQELGYA